MFKNRILVKKLYKKGGKERLLLAVGEIKNDILGIITVIETSKVKKYYRRRRYELEASLKNI